MTLADDLTISDLKPGFGARIHDIDLPSASDAELDKVVAAFHRHAARRPGGSLRRWRPSVEAVAEP